MEILCVAFGAVAIIAGLLMMGWMVVDAFRFVMREDH